MIENRLRRIAARMVADGLRRAAVLRKEARDERRMADLMSASQGAALRYSAIAKVQKAGRMEQLCGRLAAAHGIGPKRTGRGLRPRPALKKDIKLKGTVAYAR